MLGQVRSLGFVGSFLLEYGSASKLLASTDATSHSVLLKLVAAPGQLGKLAAAAHAASTFREVRVAVVCAGGQKSAADALTVVNCGQDRQRQSVPCVGCTQAWQPKH